MTHATPTTRTAPRSALRRCAIVVAWIAALHCAIVAGVLLLKPLTSSQNLLLQPDAIQELKEKIVASPKDMALRDELRRRDFELRQQYFSENAFLTTGAYLLAGGLTVLFLSLKLSTVAEPPHPRPGTAAQNSWGALRNSARPVFLLAGLAAFGLAFAIPTQTNRPAADNPPAAHAETLPDIYARITNWMRFRGPGGLGIVMDGASYPTQWSGADGAGILWKKKIPLPGDNSPIVWNGHVFLSGATEKEQRVYCYDASTGALVWETKIRVKGAPGKSPDVWEPAVLSAPTLATDGLRLYGLFANGNLFALTLAGKPVWSKALGVPENAYGHASSPITHNGILFIQLDQGYDAAEKKSALFALDGRTGKERWRQSRSVPNSWTTPILIDNNGRDELVTLANPWIIAYDPETGNEYWRAKAIEGEVAPSLAFGGGLLIAANEGFPVAAFRPGTSGDVTEANRAWTADEGAPNIASPLATDTMVLLCDSTGLATSYAIADGKKLWEYEADAPFQASPTLADDKIYLLDEEGTAYIFEHAVERKLLAKCSLGEPCHASPAFANGQIFLRSKTSLYCIGTKP